MIRKVLVLLALAMALAACGSAPPAPTDRYYRLQPVSVAPLGQAIAVQPLRAESLYGERPLVYGDESNPRQLRQYHYHLWLYAPGQLVRDHLVASLALRSGDGGVRLDGRVLRFDRLLDGQRSKAVLALELRLTRSGKILLEKTYAAEQVAVDSSIAAHVAAIEQALALIYGELRKDLVDAVR